MATNLIHGIYIHATANTNYPTAPVLGANYAQATLSGAGWETIGSRLLQGADWGHDGDLDEDTIDTGLEPVYEIIEAPRSMGPADHIVLKVPPKEFEFKCYDNAANLWTLSSNIIVSANVARPTGTLTKRSVIVEMEKYSFVWYPQCVVQASTESGGFASGGVTKLTIQVMPESTSAVPGGWRKVFKVAS